MYVFMYRYIHTYTYIHTYIDTYDIYIYVYNMYNTHTHTAADEARRHDLWRVDNRAAVHGAGRGACA